MFSSHSTDITWSITNVKQNTNIIALANCMKFEDSVNLSSAVFEKAFGPGCKQEKTP